MSDAIEGLEALIKGGPYIGPRGGKWADAKHTVPYHEQSGWTPGAKSDRKARAALEDRLWEALPSSMKSVDGDGNRQVHARGVTAKISSLSDKGLKVQLQRFEGGAKKIEAGWSKKATHAHSEALTEALSSLTDSSKKTKDKNPNNTAMVKVLNGIIEDVRNGKLRPTDRNALKTQINQHLKSARKHYNNMRQSEYKRAPANPDRQISAQDIAVARRVRDNLADTVRFINKEAKRQRAANPKGKATAAKGRATKAKNKQSRYTKEGRARTDATAEQNRKTSGGLTSADSIEAWRKKKAEMGNKSMDAIEGLEELIKAKYLTRKKVGNRYQYTYADDRRRPKKKGKKLSREQATAMVNRAQADAKARQRKNVQSMVDQVDALAETKKLAKPAKKKRAPAKLPQGIAKIRSKGKTTYYGDTSIIQGAQKALPGWTVEHMGFGEFYLSGPDGGRIDFHRRDGAGIIQNPSGREHMVTDNAGGKHVRKLVSGYRKLERAEAKLQGPHPGLAKDKADLERMINAAGTLAAGNKVEGEPHLTHEGALANIEGLKAAIAEKEAWAKQPKSDIPWHAMAVGKKSMDAIDAIEPLAKGEDVTQQLIGKYGKGKKKVEHPVSEKQRRWAYAAEEQGELPEGTARKWSRRAKGKDLPASKYVGGRGQLMGKMSKKQKKVHADVMQYLTAKMSCHDGDVTQHLIAAKKSYFEPSLKKGMYGFQEKPKNPIPDHLLNDYLMAFIEEAYEHEKRECEHKKNKPVGAREQLEFFAKLIMGELAVCVGNNSELERAAAGVNEQVIADMLNRSGLIQPQVSEQVPVDTQGHEAMCRSWVQDELQKGAKPATLTPKGSADGMYVDDTVDPFQGLRQVQAAHHTSAFAVEEAEYVAKGDGHCPIHGYGDLTKMMNLRHPYGKCTCS